MNTKNIARIGIGIALYVVLGMMVKIPLIAHISTDLGYIAFGVLLSIMGPLATLVGVLGCMIESMIVSGWVPIGWMLGQVLIGLTCGICYKKCKNVWVNILVTIVAVFLGIGGIKTAVECVLYNIPLLVKIPKNLIASVADCVPMVIGYLLTIKTPIKKYVD